MLSKQLLILFFLIGMSTIISAQELSTKDHSELLKKHPNEKEAIVWYLGHCGYAVKTKSKLLIFDYQENVKLPDRTAVLPPPNPSLFNGWINPDEIKNFEVIVFISHSHSDHYDDVIFNWEKTIKNIHYVFGWQEKDGVKYHSMPAPRKELKIDGVEIYTVNSYHSGVPESGFLVKVDGLTIFHQGDYIGRMGENAPFNITDDLKYLKTKYENVDLLFSHAGTWEPQIELMNSFNPKVAFPMHYGYREEKYTEYYSDITDKVKDIIFYIPQKKGDFCFYSEGVLIK